MNDEKVRICCRSNVKKAKKAASIEIHNYKDLVRFSEKLTGIAYNAQEL